MILVEELVKDIRQAISEPNADNSFFTDTVIISFINSVALSFGRAVRLPQVILVSNLEVGIRELGLPSNVQDVYNVMVDKNYINYFEYEDFLKSGREDETGRPTCYYLREHFDNNIRDTILALGFDNRPDTNYPIEIQATVYPVRVETIENTLPFSSECSLALKFGVLGEIYEKDVKFDKAAYYISKYNLEVDRIKNKLFNRITDYVR